MNQLIARLLHRVAHAGADLDLRAQEFGADLAAQGLLAFGEQFRRLLVREVAAILVDEEVLLLDADGEARFLDRHGSYRATFTAAKGYVPCSRKSGNEADCLATLPPIAYIPVTFKESRWMASRWSP